MTKILLKKSILHKIKKKTYYSRPKIKIYGESQTQTNIQAYNYLIQSWSSSSIQIRQETNLKNFEKNIKISQFLKIFIFFNIFSHSSTIMLDE